MVNTELLEEFQKYGIPQSMWRMLLGFAVAEGDNPSGNPTLGFVDYQLPGIGTDLDSHVKALADQLQYRLPVAGTFPAQGSDEEQAKWMAVVVGQVGSPSDWQGNAQPSQEHYIESITSNMPSEAEISAYLDDQEPAVSELVLDYDHSITPQEQYWDCGPASTQVVLSGRQQVVSESDLIAQIGTNVNGTDDISWVLRALHPRLPDGQYAVRYMPNDPPTPGQKDQLWADVSNSLNAGYGVVANIVAPPSNYPRGVKGSVSPKYSGGTVYHYVAIMGIDPDARALWIADPGFSPFGYWISFDQMATLIPPKGYAYATAVPAPTQPAPQPTGAGDEFKAWVASATDRQLLEYITNQLGPGDPAWESQPGTLRDKVFGVL